MSRNYFAGRSYRATASLAWGKNGTLRGAAFGSTQFPVLLEAGLFALKTINLSQTYAPEITFSGAVFPRVSAKNSGSDVNSATTHTVPLPPFAAGDRILVVDSHGTGVSGSLISTAGWTNLLSGAPQLGASYRDMDGTEGSSVTLEYAGGANSRASWLVYVIKAGSFDPAQAPEISATTTASNGTPDPASLTASWGADNNLFFALLATADAQTSITFPYTDESASVTSPVSATIYTTAVGHRASTNATEDPAAYAITPTSTWRAATLVMRGFTPSAGTTITPALYTDPDAFQAHSIRRTIRPNSHASTTQTLNPKLNRTLKPGAFSNAQAFFTQSIRRTLRPTAYTDADTINAHSIRRTIKPGLYSDPDTINAQSIVTGNTVAPAAFTNAQAFYSPRIRVTLKPGLYADADTFHAPTISLNRLVNPALFTNAQVFRVHTIRVTLKPTALASTTTAPSPAIRRGINPALFVNAPTFRTQTVQAPYAVQPAKHFNSQAFQVTRVIGPPTPFSGLSGLYTTGFIQYKAPKVKKQDLPRGFLLPPPEGIPEPAKIQQVRAYPLRKGELKGRTVLVNQPPPGAKPAQTDALDLILAALLLGRPNDGA